MVGLAIPTVFFLTKGRMDAARARANAALGNGGLQ